MDVGRKDGCNSVDGPGQYVLLVRAAYDGPFGNQRIIPGNGSGMQLESHDLPAVSDKRQVHRGIGHDPELIPGNHLGDQNVPVRPGRVQGCRAGYISKSGGKGQVKLESHEWVCIGDAHPH